ncbi:hypothetical protein [Microcoleus phage My-WqHQDG]|nr:hypothetical protein [Microcoleus phage My-WqHQDG]
MNIHLQQERLCQIAKAFMAHTAELESTLEVMQASFNQTIEQCNVSRIEKNTLKRITNQVSPVGLKSLLEEIKLTVDRTRLLYVEAYSEAAANLSATIYQQSGVAGPSGERSFNNKADGKLAAAKEQSQHVIKPIALSANTVTSAPITVTPTPMRTIKETPAPASGIARYKHYASEYPILTALTAPKEPPSAVHKWVTTCGYLMDSTNNARASIDKGLNALLWPSNDPNSVNAVTGVHVLPHPSGSGNVFMLTMNYPTTGNEAMHVQQCGLIDLTEGKVWVPKRYPLSIVVEVSPKASRECPFGRISDQRKGWEVINKYLINQQQSTRTPNNHETNSTNRKPRNSDTPRRKPETIY